MYTDGSRTLFRPRSKCSKRLGRQGSQTNGGCQPSSHFCSSSMPDIGLNRWALVDLDHVEPFCASSVGPPQRKTPKKAHVIDAETLTSICLRSKNGHPRY